MSIPRRTLRRTVERFPIVAKTYRSIRDTLALTRARPHDTPLGFRFLGPPTMARGEFEPEETSFLASAIKHDTVVVDVGANTGFFTCVAAHRGAHVVSVEPLPENLSYLYMNVLLNGFENVEIFPMGVSHRPSVADLYGGNTGASLVRGWADASPAHRTIIPTTTLDILLGDRFPARQLILKVDVEGAELDVLRGATTTLNRTPRPIWMMEVALTEHHPRGLNPHFAATFDLFWANGYRCHTLEGPPREVTRRDVDDWVTSRRRAFGTYNYVFA